MQPHGDTCSDEDYLLDERTKQIVLRLVQREIAELQAAFASAYNDPAVKVLDEVLALFNGGKLDPDGGGK